MRVVRLLVHAGRDVGDIQGEKEGSEEGDKVMAESDEMIAEIPTSAFGS